MKVNLTVTKRGVITLPAKVRHALGIKSDVTLTAELTADGLLLRPVRPIEIYSDARVREFDAAEEELSRVLGDGARMVRARVSEKGINEQDVADAVTWARAQKTKSRRKPRK